MILHCSLLFFLFPLSRVSDSFVLDYLFKGVCTAKSRGKQRPSLPPEQRTDLFALQDKKPDASLFCKD